MFTGVYICIDMKFQIHFIHIDIDIDTHIHTHTHVYVCMCVYKIFPGSLNHSHIPKLQRMDVSRFK